MNTWKYIANRYRNVPNLVIELINEPQVLSNAPNFSYSLAGSAYKTFNENIISSIESVETTSHLKLVEPLFDLGTGNRWDPMVDGAMDVDKTNVAWAFHFYNPMTGWDPNGSYWHESFTWRGQYYRQASANGTIYVIWRITRVCDKIRTWNKPLTVTEFGKNTQTETYWKEWYQLVLDTLSVYAPSGYIIHEYGRDPQFNPGFNLVNPTTQQSVLPIVMPYLNSQWLRVERRP